MGLHISSRKEGTNISVVKHDQKIIGTIERTTGTHKYVARSIHRNLEKPHIKPKNAALWLKQQDDEVQSVKSNNIKEHLIIVESESDDRLVDVVKIIECNGIVGSKRIATGVNQIRATQIVEDAIALNSVQSGHVQGIGFGEKGEPGVNKRRRAKLLRRSIR